MYSLQQLPQSDSRVIALGDERNYKDFIHKMNSHSMALYLQRIPLENELYYLAEAPL